MAVVMAFFTFIFPAVLLVFIDGTTSGTVKSAAGTVDAAQYFTPSLAIFGLSFGCYTSLIFAIPRARERGILKRVRGTPVQPSVYLASLIAVALVAGVGSVVVLVVLGVAKFGVHLYPTLLPEGAADFERPLQLLAKSLAFRDPLDGQPRVFDSPR